MTQCQKKYVFLPKIRNMKVKLYYILLIFATICACEKLDTTVPNPSEEENEQGSDTATIPVAAYSVDDVLNGEIVDAFYANADTSFAKVWLSGYIVGYVNGTKLSSATFEAGEKMTNILLADSPLETDYGNCIPVQLSTSSAANKQVREALNLSTHPDNLRKKVCVLGDIVLYMSAIGMKNVTKYNFLPDDFDYNNPPKEPDINKDDKEDNNGNEQTNNDDKEDKGDNKDDNNKDKEDDNDKNPLAIDTYTVSYMRHELTEYFNTEDIKSISNCSVKGYIVGYVRKNKNNLSQTSFELVLPSETNIVLADSPEERDYNNCIAVQLGTSSSYIKARNALNLKAHPENLGKLVIVTGSIENYMGALGVKNTKDYTFLE